ncbi:hypothetical protein Dda3937_01878 [Dickeya dadantii 3937]|uniref:Uncharacterized protein n=1 Tax=Dickeya dadantii (strain 3937) TaxID=198628 RepID=E0SJL1_DICD3|nr:hypothetical protein Dda3937_01878 [Dickeya dadantii 3937]
MQHVVHQALIENNPATNLGSIIAPPVKRHSPAAGATIGTVDTH